MNNTIFITGASSGIGKATAKLFAEKGWNVIATMRKPENETELNQLANVSVLQLDVTNLENIEKTVQNVLQNGDVDVVFNNAGYALLGPLEAFSDEQIVSQMETNFLGPVRVTKAFLPYFRDKKAGLFITTGSVAGLVGLPAGSMYDASKWAVDGWSESLSFELAQFGIGIKTIEPGMVSTEIGNKSTTFYHPAYNDLMEKVDAITKGAQMADAALIAETVYEAATDGSNRLRYVCGDDAKAMIAQREAVGAEAFREGIQQMLDSGKWS